MILIILCFVYIDFEMVGNIVVTTLRRVPSKVEEKIVVDYQALFFK